MVAQKVRELRVARRWTQAELATKLRLSQSRFSQVERGEGSFTAEQLLVMLALFNVPVSEFSSRRRSSVTTTDVQQALARLGAFHLREATDVLPSERVSEVLDAVHEALVGAESPRLVTALGPVIVHNVDRLRLRKLEQRMLEVGLERRLYWLLENLLEALGQERSTQLPREWARSYRRAETVIAAFADAARQGTQAHEGPPRPDVLDAGIRSRQTLRDVGAAGSEISRRWGIVTTIQPLDFVAALRAAREGHS